MVFGEANCAFRLFGRWFGGAVLPPMHDGSGRLNKH